MIPSSSGMKVYKLQLDMKTLIWKLKIAFNWDWMKLMDSSSLVVMAI